jgi:hypothetical protein
VELTLDYAANYIVKEEGDLHDHERAVGKIIYKAKENV